MRLRDDGLLTRMGRSGTPDQRGAQPRAQAFALRLIMGQGRGAVLE